MCGDCVGLMVGWWCIGCCVLWGKCGFYDVMCLLCSMFLIGIGLNGCWCCMMSV